MPPRLNLFHTSRTLPLRPYNAVPRFISRPAACRTYASDPSKDLPVAKDEEPVGPNMQQQEHVSEEAAKMAKITGGEGPDLDQGTPVQDILKEDAEARSTAPKVIKADIKAQKSPPKPQSRPFSTCAPRRAAGLETTDAASLGEFDPSLLPMEPTDAPKTETPTLTPSTTYPSTYTSDSTGHKYPLPTLPLQNNLNKDYRYDPVVKQVTNLMMRDGKLAVAQRNMAFIMHHLRTATPPTYSQLRPMMPGAPPAAHLPLNPVLYLTLALDSVAPLLRIRSQRGAAGGGVALQIPVPLGLRQRRRQAFVWILDAASKKPNRGSGRGMLAKRIAEEIVAVVEGRSSIWERRIGVHKLATTARSNLILRPRRR